MNHKRLHTIPALPLRHHEAARAAVIAAFRDCDPHDLDALRTLSSREWTALLYWLDTSGLALYFYDRMSERGLLALLPSHVRTRLEENLRDNTARIASLLDDCCAIQSAFQSAGITYAVLKGFSLWPHSVPRLELRSQLDLDFLVASDDALRAQAILEDHGYKLHAISGRSREFKTPCANPPTLADLYKPTPHRVVELHLEDKRNGRLARCEHHALREVAMPVLPIADLFLNQALHFYKHLSRDQVRCSHLIELYRHVLARAGDHDFWAHVQTLCAASPKQAQQLGVALEFISQQLDPLCIPAAVRLWTIDRVPVAARLWVRRYSARVITASFPGTKLYLLLQEAMLTQEDHQADPSPNAPSRRLIPLRLPPPIVIPPPDETLRQAAQRQLRQARFVLFRLRYHLREGLRYRAERRRWHSLLQAETRSANSSAALSANPARSATKL